MAYIVMGPPAPPQTEQGGSLASQMARRYLGAPRPFGVSVEGDVTAVGQAVADAGGGVTQFKRAYDDSSGNVLYIFVNTANVLWVEGD